MEFQLDLGQVQQETTIDESKLEASVTQITKKSDSSLEEFIERFSKRYDDEKSFRESVNQYMGITSFKKFTLGFTRKILPSKYNQSKKKLIKEYATAIKKGLDEAEQLRLEMEELKKEKEESEKNKSQYSASLDKENQASQTYRQTLEEKTTGLQTLETEHSKTVSELEIKTQEEVKRIQQETDTKAIAMEKLSDYVKSLPLVKVNEAGVLSFDEEKIVQMLQERFLDEIVNGIEQESGQTGFYSKIKRQYTDLTAYFDEMQDLSELPDTDWVQSIIYSRTKGYRLPQYPFLITGKKEERIFNKASIDTAIIIDSSGSMRGDKIELAKKAGMANHALMRRLNPKNNTYLAYYNEKVHPVDSVSFLRGVEADGWTRTDLALEWLYNSLEGKGMGIAYLISDGAPEGPEGRDEVVKKCVKAAAHFANNPYVMLRIFLVEPNDEVNSIVKKIGKAAGHDTKVIPVTRQDIGKGIVQDISGSIGQMYSVMD